MSLLKARRKRKDNNKDDNIDMKTAILPDVNGTSIRKKLKTNDSGGSISSTLGCIGECFSCKLKDENLDKCSLSSCDKLYHRKCLESLPNLKAEVNLCPLHMCLPCYNANPKNPQISKGDMLSCTECPVAFHNNDACFIPGAVISSESMMCPKHFTPEKHRNYPGIMKLTFCVDCSCNKDLMFCKFCPAAIYKHCCKTKVISEEDFTCDRCTVRKTISFNDVVWAKVYDFRWWPAVVSNPKDLPDAVNEMKHFEGEFPVKFFGSNEHYWIQHGRVYPFFYKKLLFEDKHLNDFKKVVPDTDFDDAVRLARAAIVNKTFRSVEPVNHKKPPPYKHIKSNRPIGDVQIYTLHDISDHNTCGCKREDPCGYNSMCLNRSMCTECHKDTCEAGDRCRNQKFQKLEYPAMKPFWTEKRGWGLKCLEDIKKGSFVNEYVGDLIDKEECERRIRQKQLVGDTNFYFCTLDSTRIIDAGPKGNFSRFMNHSCEPNCETQKWMVLGDARVGIFAKQDIPAGTELTFDYQMDFSHFEKLKCNCGSKRCSGLIGKKPHTNGIQEEEALADCEDENVTKKGKTKSTTKVENPLEKQNGNTKKNGKEKNSTKAQVSHVQNGCVKKDKNSTKAQISQNGSVKKDKNSTKAQNGSVKNNVKKQNGLKKDKLLCFKCKTGGKLIDCSLKDCGKSFHIRCLKAGFDVKDKVPPKWKCPVHFCKKCKESSVYQCYACPNSFCENHARSKSKSGKFACPKHSDIEQ